MPMSNGNLKIPYGVSDFKILRKEGLYFVDKSGYIRALELCGRFLLFVRNNGAIPFCPEPE